MPKRSLLIIAFLALAISACKTSSTTPSPTPSPTPTINTTTTTGVVNATYDSNPYYPGTIYANAATSGCPGSTTVGGSTLQAATVQTTYNGQQVGQATFSSTNGNALTPNTYYTFFYVIPSGPTVSTCTLSWTYADVTLSYP